MAGITNLDDISPKLDRITKLAERLPNKALTPLNHYIDMAWMREAYRRTRKDGAPGVDGQSAKQFEQGLEDNLQDLLDGAKSGRYRAPPVKRVHIPKGDGRTRPIGIPTLSDKVLQRAVHMLLEPIYEHDFLDCSFGFRPGRSAHQALSHIRNTLMEMRGGWVLEVDIEQFFDSLDHEHLRSFLQQRVRDGVVLRMIGKWLNAGVFEGGAVRRSSEGTPQGGVISPLLANIYLHEVLDKWFDETVQERLKGRSELVRYADDFVMIFEHESDARRVWSVLAKRMAKYGLRLHPEKTRLVKFGRPPRDPKRSRPLGRTFDFLGFTHYWTKSRKGNQVIKQKTAKNRLARFAKRIWAWCALHRHASVPDQWMALRRKLRGHLSYYDLIGNEDAIRKACNRVFTAWRYWLNCRSNRAKVTWAKMRKITSRYRLPQQRPRYTQ